MAPQRAILIATKVREGDTNPSQLIHSFGPVIRMASVRGLDQGVLKTSLGLPKGLRATQFYDWHANCLMPLRSLAASRVEWNAEDNGCRIVKQGGKASGGRSSNEPLG